MFRWFIFLVALSLSFGVSGQVYISGRVLDGKKKPVPGVSLGIRDSYDGATSDSAGNFKFSTTEKGNHIITASSIGFRNFEQPVNIGTESLVIDILLKDEISELKAVVISAGTFEASDKKKGTVLSPIDIVTTASGNADVVGALKSLPGAQQVEQLRKQELLSMVPLSIISFTAVSQILPSVAAFRHSYLKVPFSVPGAILPCMARRYLLP
jgi:vitamin B12 transporter